MIVAWLAYCALAGAASVVAGLLHEATHAAAARVLGGRVVDVGRDGWALYVDWQPPQDASSLDIRLVLLAPALVGWGVAAVWTARHGWPNLSPASIIGVLGWVVYTIGGGLEDYYPRRAAAAYSERDQQHGGESQA